MKKFLGPLILGLSIVGCKTDPGSPVVMTTEDEKTFYAIGARYGENFKDLSLTPTELQALVGGFTHGASGKELQVDINQYSQKWRDLHQKKYQDVINREKGKGKKYIEEFVKNGGSVTASGLAYKITEAGNKSEVPSVTDVVTVDYEGKLVDGTVFDSSIKRGKPVSFPLNGVIPGWQEGIRLIGSGGKITLVIPSELAYKDFGAPPTIPGGATLVFDVTLHGFTKEAPAQEIKKK